MLCRMPLSPEQPIYPFFLHCGVGADKYVSLHFAYSESEAN